MEVFIKYQVLVLSHFCVLSLLSCITVGTTPLRDEERERLMEERN